MQATHLLLRRKCSVLVGLTLCVNALAVDVNAANEAELDSVKGLGPSSTARILKARDAGPFKDWTDLMKRVKGIRPPSAKRLSNAGLTVQGKPFDDNQQQER